MRDRYNRTIDYMRISITDRCNLRCTYCMPQDIALTSMANLLDLRGDYRICSRASEVGISGLKVTGVATPRPKGVCLADPANEKIRALSRSQ